MARLGQDKVEEVRTRADIMEIVGAQLKLRRSGRNFVGLCPFHNEKTPSFSVNPERGFFHCFGCGAGGTVFDFVMRLQGLTFAEALRALAGRYGIALPEGSAGDGAGSLGERESYAHTNLFAAEFYAHVLWNTPDGELGRDYLRTRGITVETARAFLLGFAPSRPANLSANLQKRGLLEPALKLGLVRREQDGSLRDMFRARLMFPIRDTLARVIAFGGRVLDNRLPKYINSAESPLYSKARVLYGTYEARQAIGSADRAIVVEGYIDAIALWQAGFRETVASLGTSLTVEQLRLLSRYTRNLVACFDGDEAGRRASMRALEVSLQAGLFGRGAFIPPGHDPDTLVRERGADGFRELLEQSELLADFFLREQARAARASDGARVRAAERVVDMLRMVADPFELDILTRKAAGLLGISDEVLRRQARGAGARPPVAVSAPASRHRFDAVAQAELGLVMLAAHYPGLRPELKLRAAKIEFADSAMCSLLEEICTSDRTEQSLEVMIMSRLDDERRQQLSAMLVGPLVDAPDKAAALMRDFLSTLVQSQRGREVAQLRVAATSDDVNEAAAAAQAVIIARRRGRSS